MDWSSGQWLSVKWVAAGGAAIPRHEWDMVLKRVGLMLEGGEVLTVYDVVA